MKLYLLLFYCSFCAHSKVIKWQSSVACSRKSSTSQHYFQQIRLHLVGIASTCIQIDPPPSPVNQPLVGTYLRFHSNRPVISAGSWYIHRDRYDPVTGYRLSGGIQWHFTIHVISIQGGRQCHSLLIYTRTIRLGNLILQHETCCDRNRSTLVPLLLFGMVKTKTNTEIKQKDRRKTELKKCWSAENL